MASPPQNSSVLTDATQTSRDIAAPMDVDKPPAPSNATPTPQKRGAENDQNTESTRKRSKPASSSSTSTPQPKTAPKGTTLTASTPSSAKGEKQREKERKAAERAAEKALKEQKLAEKKAEKDKRDAEKAAKLAEKKAEKEKREAEKEKREAERRAAKEADEAKLSKQRALLGTFFKTAVKRTDDAPKQHVPDAAIACNGSFWQHFPPFQVSARTQVAKHNVFAKSLPENFLETLFNNDGDPAKPCFRREPAALPSTATALPSGWKLLQFHTDLRPAYWGGWNKTSKVISGRRPFAQDSALLEYDYDSEAEWEEEEPGEVIGSDNEDDKEEDGADSDDEEDNWLVPHGYLSDDEGMANDERPPLLLSPSLKAGAGNDQKRSKDAPKWGVLAPLVPVIHGPCFVGTYFGSDTTTTEEQRPAWRALVHLRAQLLFVDINNTTPIGLDPLKPEPTAFLDHHPHNTTATTASAKNNNTPSPPFSSSNSISSKKTGGPRKHIFPSDQLPNLLAKINNNGKPLIAGLSKLIDELRAAPQFASIPKATLEAKVRQVAVREKRGGDQRACWYLREPLPTG
ncbi:Chromatin assembly factor 1, subunit A [Geranomyces michiganensis]|nr:Chromatin assembly factor 1, subunit A [Geranomyces michiganensis]